jgi:hypothetical protein
MVGSGAAGALGAVAPSTRAAAKINDKKRDVRVIQVQELV